jgi:ribokinase
MRKSIVVVGSSNTDLIVTAPRIPVPGETVIGNSFSTAAGGKGANQAVAAARLGGEVTFVGRIGVDPYGDASIDNLGRENIAIDTIVRDPDNPSGIALITVDAHGENSIVVASGSNMAMTFPDVHCAAKAIERARIVLLQLEIPMMIVEEVADMARRSGGMVILNPAPAAELSDKLLQNVHILIPNSSEASQLSGIPVTDEQSAARAAKALRSRGVETVIVTLGDRGAIVVDGEAIRHFPAYQVTPKDTTGAGDAFCGALSVGIADGLEVNAAIKFASKAAALSTQNMGAQTSMPQRADLGESEQ